VHCVIRESGFFLSFFFLRGVGGCYKLVLLVSTLVLPFTYLTIIVYENEDSSTSFLISSRLLGAVLCCTAGVSGTALAGVTYPLGGVCEMGELVRAPCLSCGSSLPRGILPSLPPFLAFGDMHAGGLQRRRMWF